MPIYSPARDPRYRVVVQIVKVAPITWEQHDWYVTHDDYSRAVLGEPLADPVYRQGYGARLKRIDASQPARFAEIAAEIRSQADSICAMTRDFVAAHPGGW
jgi:hypothetical protein